MSIIHEIFGDSDLKDLSTIKSKFIGENNIKIDFGEIWTKDKWRVVNSLRNNDFIRLKEVFNRCKYMIDINIEDIYCCAFSFCTDINILNWLKTNYPFDDNLLDIGAYNSIRYGNEITFNWLCDNINYNKLDIIQKNIDFYEKINMYP